MTPSVLARLEGMKYPDEMVTRFFFKSGLHRRTGRVLELGCGNAANLALFAGHGWTCMGLDLDAGLLDQGRRNFALQGYPEPRLEAGDMNEALPDFGRLDVLLLPSSLYYVQRRRAVEIVAGLAPTLNPGASVFCRFRTPNDHRYGKGEALGDDGFSLTIDETSEAGCTVAFYTPAAMLEVLAPCRLAPSSVRLMRLAFDNLGRDDRLIANDDCILWGNR